MPSRSAGQNGQRRRRAYALAAIGLLAAAAVATLGWAGDGVLRAAIRGDTERHLAAVTAAATVLVGVLAVWLSLWLWWRWDDAAGRAQRLALELQRQTLAERFDFLTRYANDAILLFDAEERVQEVNERALALYGYDREAFGQLRLADLRAEGESARLAPLWETLPQREALLYETLHRRRDGSVFPVECSMRRLAQGEQTVYQAIVRDIAERKQAEQHIARLGRLLRLRSRVNAALVHAATLPALQQEACRLLVEEGGYRQVWMGRVEPDAVRLTALAAPGGPAPALSAAQSLLSGGALAPRPGALQVCNDVRRDPRTAPWRARLLEAGIAACALVPVPSRAPPDTQLVVESGEPDVFDAETLDLLRDLAGDLGFAQDSFDTQRQVSEDITARKQAEEALGRFALLARHSRDIVLFMRGEDGRLLEANEAALHAYGYAREELLALTIQDLRAPGTQAAVTDQMAAADAHGVLFETVHRRRDGRTFPVEVSSQGALIGETETLISVIRDITKRKRAEEALCLSQERFARAFSANPAALTLSRLADGRILDVNETFLTLSGYRREEVVGQSSLSLTLWPSPEERARDIQALERDGEFRHLEQTLLTKSGEPRVLLLSGDRLTVGGEDLILFTGLDITARKQAEQALRAAHDTREAILQAMTEGLVIASPAGVAIDINPAAQRLYGFASKDEALRALAASPDLFEVRDLADEVQPPETWPLARACRGEVFSQRELQVRRRDTGQSWIASYGGTPVRDADGRVQLGIVTLRDITAQKRAEEQIRQLAFYDPLTRLPNRRLLEERLGTALALATRQRTGLAVMVLDLDFFKRINDSLGHAVGDALLVEVARRMRDCVRAADTVARPGGDEFMLVLPGAGAEGAAHVAAKLVAGLAAPLRLEGHTLTIGCSLGISLCPDNGTDASVLIARADTAMYRAKQEGRNRYQFFTEDMQRAALRAMTLEQQLRQALAGEGEGLCLHYQPQVDLASGQAVGLEALVRWAHPEHGLLGAGAFVPLAETSGLIQDLGAWVLRAVGEQLQAWRRAGLPLLPVALNLSAKQLRHPERRAVLCAQVGALLAASDLAPGLIELELTENSLLEDTEDTLATLQALRALGVRLTLDGFGTGYSSLRTLQAFPVDRLKIDQSFVRAAPEHPQPAAMVETILTLGRHLALATIAEGVETEPQLAQLRRQGCRQAQGYYFSRPLPPAKVEDWLRRAA